MMSWSVLNIIIWGVLMIIWRVLVIIWRVLVILFISPAWRLEPGDSREQN